VTGSASVSVLGASSQRPLVGREAELRRIAEARAAGVGAVVVRSGMGVGKSSLARAALAEAEHDGAVTAWVQATRSAASVPLGAFAGMIQSEVGRDNPSELLRSGVRALANLAGGRPLALGVDDAQLLDPTSAALVLHVISTGTAFVVATVRTGEPCPDAIESLWEDAGTERLELLELSQDETVQLVEDLAGGPVEEGAHQWVWETSRGNALYASELVRGALASGALGPVDGLWRLTVRPGISPSLAELVSARMTSIEPKEHEVLELLALGEPLRLAELTELTDERSVVSAEVRRLISVESGAGGGEVRLAHPVYGEAIRASLPSLQANGLRVRLARLLEGDSGRRAEDSLRIARWLLDAGEPIPQRLLLGAADAAVRSGAPELAAELAQQAIDAGAGVAAVLVLARAHAARNHFEQAEQVLAPAESRIETRDQALRYLELQVRVLYWGLQRAEQLRQLLTRALGWWPDEEWGLALAPLRLYVDSRGSPRARDSAITESTELLRTDKLDPSVRRNVQFSKLSALLYAGRGREAYELGQAIRHRLRRRTPSIRESCVLPVAPASRPASGWPSWSSGRLTR
jgi:hypothetical protein